VPRCAARRLAIGELSMDGVKFAAELREQFIAQGPVDAMF
jgi:hypothetical protein